jgi:hypothetical protein
MHKVQNTKQIISLSQMFIIYDFKYDFIECSNLKK